MKTKSALNTSYQCLSLFLNTVEGVRNLSQECNVETVCGTSMSSCGILLPVGVARERMETLD